MIFKILLNYLILLIGVAGFRSGAFLILAFPILQILISWFHYSSNHKWQTVLMLEIHLLISTVLGIFLEGYLFLQYISNDAESVLIFQVALRIGAVLVFGLGILTTGMKYISTKRKGKRVKEAADQES